MCTFFKFFSVDSLYPEWVIWERFVLERNKALLLDSLSAETTHPIQVEQAKVLKIPDIVEELDIINKYKGASVLFMIHEKLKEIELTSFQQAISSYVKLNAYLDVETKFLLDSFQHFSSFPVSQYLENWIFKSHYPIVSLSESSNSTLVATQSVFYLNLPQPANTTWWITLSVQYTSQQSQIYNYDFNQTTSAPFAQSHSNSLYTIINPMRVGHYRVLYTTQMLDNIIETMKTSGIETYDEEDISGILDDIFATSRSSSTDFGYSIGKFFDICANVRNSKNPYFWSYLVDVFDQLHFLLNFPPFDSNFDQFIRYLFANVFQYIGFDSKENETFKDKLLRFFLIFIFILFLFLFFILFLFYFFFNFYFLIFNLFYYFFILDQMSCQ